MRVFKCFAQAHSTYDNIGRCRVRPFGPEPSLLTIALRHRNPVHICISKGNHRKVSCLGEHNTQGTSPPWANKQSRGGTPKARGLRTWPMRKSIPGHGLRFVRPGLPIARNIQPINRLWTDDISSLPNQPAKQLAVLSILSLEAKYLHGILWWMHDYLVLAT